MKKQAGLCVGSLSRKKEREPRSLVCIIRLRTIRASHFTRAERILLVHPTCFICPPTVFNCSYTVYPYPPQ